MKKNYIVLVAILGCFISFSVFARNFDVRSKTFSCIATMPNAMITFQTHNLDAAGFSCKATKEQNKGSVILKGSEVNNVYFLVKPGSKNPYMEVTPDNAIKNCFAPAKTNNRKPYHPNDKYCSSAPSE